MNVYNRSAQQAAKVVTQNFSTSFGSAIRLIDKSVRQDIYNIYGLVRIADEIVDTYQGTDAAKILSQLQTETYAAMKSGFSANVIVHAFCLTANTYGIAAELIDPFFESMRMDLTQKTFTQKAYKNYIHGSAEVVGLMCLKVYVQDDAQQYDALKPGAIALGAAFQKVNFLRDIHDDFVSRGRYYFPVGSYESFDEAIKDNIMQDIQADFDRANEAIKKLPPSAKLATKLAYDYYMELLKKLEHTPAEVIKQKRVRVKQSVKLKLLVKARAHGK